MTTMFCGGVPTGFSVPSPTVRTFPILSHSQPSSTPATETADLRRRLELEARSRRRDHRRFLDLLTVTPALTRRLDGDPALQVHLNPVRGWIGGRDSSGADSSTPAGDAAVLFAVGSRVREFQGDEIQRALLHELAALGPTTLDNWLRYNRAYGRSVGRSDLLELVQIGAEIGLIAVG